MVHIKKKFNLLKNPGKLPRETTREKYTIKYNDLFRDKI